MNTRAHYFLSLLVFVYLLRLWAYFIFSCNNLCEEMTITNKCSSIQIDLQTHRLRGCSTCSVISCVSFPHRMRYHDNFVKMHFYFSTPAKCQLSSTFVVVLSLALDIVLHSTTLFWYCCSEVQSYRQPKTPRFPIWTSFWDFILTTLSWPHWSLSLSLLLRAFLSSFALLCC